MGLPRWCSGKEFPSANTGDARDVVLIPGLGRPPGVGNGNPLQLFLPGEFHKQRSPWGCK